MKSLVNKLKKMVVWMTATGFILASCKVPDNSQGVNEGTNALTPPSKPANEQLLQLGQTVYHLMFGPPAKGSDYQTYVKDSNFALD